jgi:hypothetical protein
MVRPPPEPQSELRRLCDLHNLPLADKSKREGDRRTSPLSLWNDLDTLGHQLDLDTLGHQLADFWIERIPLFRRSGRGVRELIPRLCGAHTTVRPAGERGSCARPRAGCCSGPESSNLFPPRASTDVIVTFSFQGGSDAGAMIDASYRGRAALTAFAMEWLLA